MKYLFFLISFYLFLNISCGVKGRPLPPMSPREIGYGKPQYDGANRTFLEKDEEVDSGKKKLERNP